MMGCCHAPENHDLPVEMAAVEPKTLGEFSLVFEFGRLRHPRAISCIQVSMMFNCFIQSVYIVYIS